MRRDRKNSKFIFLSLFLSVSTFSGELRTNLNEKVIIGRDNVAKEIVFEDGTGTPAKIQASSGDISTNTSLTVNGDLGSSGQITTTNGTITLGDGTNKDVGLSAALDGKTPFLKYDSAANAWVKSDDGSLVKKLGTGSGSGSSGINFIKNNSFEDPGLPILNWSNTGGTLTQETHTNAREGNDKFARFVATTSGQYFESDEIVISDDVGPGCMADFKYSQGDNAFKYEILKFPYVYPDDVVSGGDVADFSNFLKAPTVVLDCLGGDKFKFRITSTAAGTIDADGDVYLGSNKNISPFGKGAHFVGRAVWQYGAGCSATISGSSFTDFPADADCSSPTLFGDISNAGNNKFSIKLKKRSKGVYRFVISNINKTGGNGAYNHQIKMVSGSNETSVFNIFGPSPSDGSSTELIFLSNDNASDEIWTLQGKSSGTDTLNVMAVSPSTDTEFSISVYFFPDSTQATEAFTPEQANFFVSALVRGTSNYSSGTDANFQPMVTTAGDKTFTQKIGSSSKLCSDGSLDGVCDPMFGLGVNVPVAGLLKVCMNPVFDQVTISGAGYQEDEYKIAEVDSSLTVLSVGVESSWITGTDNSTTEGTTNGGAICSYFNSSNVGIKRFALARKKYISSTNTRSIGKNNLQDFGITVELVQNNVARPVLQNMVDTKDVNARIQSCRVNGMSGTPLAQGDGCSSWVTSLADLGAGQYRLNLITGTYGNNPDCSVTHSEINGTNPDSLVSLKASSTVAVDVIIRDLSAGSNPIDSEVIILCKGAR